MTSIVSRCMVGVARCEVWFVGLNVAGTFRSVIGGSVSWFLVSSVAHRIQILRIELVLITFIVV